MAVQTGLGCSISSPSRVSCGFDEYGDANMGGRAYLPLSMVNLDTKVKVKYLSFELEWWHLRVVVGISGHCGERDV